MSYELRVTVENERRVSTESDQGSEVSADIPPDRLRRDTIGIFEQWLRQGKITERRELQVLGSHLYSMLFNGPIEDSFRRMLGAVPQGQRLRLLLVFKKEALPLARLPWEYLYRPDDETERGYFLSTHVDLVLSRYMRLNKPRPNLAPAEGPLQILIVRSQPPQLAPVLDTAVIERIQQVPETRCEVFDQPTIERFTEKLEERVHANAAPHVIHFLGHGRFAADKGQIAFLKPNGTEADWVSDQQFAETFVNTRCVPRLVFLHLCEGGVVDFTANFAGLAPQLVLAGVPAVVAMQYPITNAAAITFSCAFYREVARGEPIDYAVQSGRWRITLEDGNAYNTRVFGTPVLYMQSYDGIIKPAQPGSAKKEPLPFGQAGAGVHLDAPRG